MLFWNVITPRSLMDKAVAYEATDPSSNLGEGDNLL